MPEQSPALPNVETQLCGIPLKNPVMPASGTFGFGYEMAAWYDLNELGAIVLKGTTREARFGNPTPRIAEAQSGVLNAIGLQNPGVRAVVQEELPRLREVYSGPVIANISGFSVEEYVYTAQMFDRESDVALLEINISCPNVHGGGLAFGTSCEGAAEVIAAVKAAMNKPVLAKLSPNVTDIVSIARACAEAGADGLVLVNTLLGLRLNPANGRPLVSTGSCGFSGPAIKPVALRMVYEVCGAVNVPVVGVGGIATPDDALEFLWAGASAVQVGAQGLIDPMACQRLAAALPGALAGYGISSVKDMIGRAHT